MSKINNLFDGMVIFHEVVKLGSFAGAAKSLNHSPSHISKEITKLEDRLATRLLNRTTRTLSLTEMGKIYYQHAAQMVHEAQCLDQQIMSQKDKPFGLLKISVADIFCKNYLNLWLPEFLYQHPDIRLQMDSSNRHVDLVAEEYDVVIRSSLVGNSDLISRKLMDIGSVTVASPQYLKENGIPKNPQELSHHKLIGFSNGSPIKVWHYKDINNKAMQINVTPHIVCDSAETEISLAKNGLGITRLPEISCKKELDDGSLVRILEDYEKEPLSLFALYPSRAHLAAKVRAFIDFIVDKIEAESS